MKFPERLTKCLVAQIDFSTFYVLDVISHRVHKSVVLLLPKKRIVNAYYAMSVGEYTHWYCSVESMLDMAVECKYIGRVRRAVLLLRARRIYRNH